jgi:hypothetical protein
MLWSKDQKVLTGREKREAENVMEKDGPSLPTKSLAVA